MKRKRMSSKTDRMYMSVQTIYLGLQVITPEQQNRNEIVLHLLRTTLASDNGSNSRDERKDEELSRKRTYCSEGRRKGSNHDVTGS